MKIELLRKRENFLKIFKDSVSNFFKKKYDLNELIKTKYVINDRLNVIYPINIKRNKLNNLVSEFRYHKYFYLRVLQTLYTFISIRKPFEFIFCSEIINIKIPKEELDQLVFIPGNHSIRSINILNNKTHVFVKENFNIKFIVSDANARILNPSLKAPKVIHFHNNWYQEERVSGLPWNRVASESLKTELIKKAQKQLNNLYSSSGSNVLSSNYIINISADINLLLESSMSSLSEKNKNIIDAYLYELEALFSKNYINSSIDLVFTHGDFQPGNILCSEDDYWIIDWEYSGKRSIFYDALIFDLDCRSPKGLCNRLKSNLELNYNSDSYLSWTGKNLNKRNFFYLYIFFAEDLLLRMQEISVDSIHSKDQALSLYLIELQEIQTLLKSYLYN
jgi:hypothetical protein